TWGISTGSSRRSSARPETSAARRRNLRWLSRRPDPGRTRDHRERGLTFRRAHSVALAVCLVAGLLAGCRKEEPKPVEAPRLAPRRTPAPVLRFEEKATACGINFTHVNGAKGDKWMPETMGGGVAVLDYDGDGRPDLLFVSGSYWPGDPRAKDL